MLKLKGAEVRRLLFYTYLKSCGAGWKNPPAGSNIILFRLQASFYERT